MQRRFTHRFAGPLDAVLSTLTDREYAQALVHAHSFFAEIQVLALQASRARVTRTVRYRARPFLARLGPFSPPRAWFVWTEHSELDRATGIFRFDNVPELASVRAKVTNRGTMQFRTQRDDHGKLVTTREATFELGLSVARTYAPLVSVALAQIGNQLESSLDEEARFLAAWLERAERARSVERALPA